MKKIGVSLKNILLLFRKLTNQIKGYGDFEI